MRSPTRRATPCIAAVALAMVLVVVVSAAQAQGFRMGLAAALPPPISSLDLTGYAGAMNLAPEQMRAWSEMHERYKADFAKLGEDGGAIHAFIEARKAAEGIPFRAQPPKADLERWLDSHAAANNAIKLLDDRLFDELAPLLVGDQPALLQRAKLSRERVRLMRDELVNEWLDPSVEVDLCKLFTNMESESGAATADMTADQRAAAWALLDAYQQQFVSKLRSLQESSRDMHREWAKQLEEQGVQPHALDMSKQGFDRELLNTVSRTWFAVTEKVKPQAIELQQLNRSGVKRVAEALPASAGRHLRRTHARAAYPGGVESLDAQEREVMRALEMSDLSEQERQALEAQLAAFRVQADAAMESYADASDAIFAAHGPSYSRMTNEIQDAHGAAITAINDLCHASREALVNLIGKDRLQAHFGQGSDDRYRQMIRDGGMTDPEEIEEVLAQLKRGGSAIIGRRESPDQAVADAIARSAIEATISALQLPEETASVARQLHADYRQQYRKQFDDSSDAMINLRIGFMTRGDAENGNQYASYAPLEDVQKAIALEKQTLASLRQIDAAFLSDLQAALGVNDDALWRLRLARNWSVLARGGRKGLDDLRAYEASVSLLAIAENLSLSPEEWKPVEDVLGTREGELLAAARAHFDANRAAWFARDIYLSHSAGPVRSAADVTQKAEAEALELEQAAKKKRAVLAALTKSILDELCAALPERAAALRDGYERAAYPRVFKDASDAGPLLASALALKDLNEPQRTELQAAAEAFPPAYRDVCIRMIAVNQEWDAQTQYAPEGRKKRDEAKYKWDQLVFERNELNAGVRATLKHVLTPQQRAAIGMPSE